MFLIFLPSTPPVITVPPDAVERATLKVQDFRTSLESGRNSTLEMDQPELNGWLGENLALKPPPASGVSPANKPVAPGEPEAPTVAEIESYVRGVKIELLQNSLRAYVAFELYGKTMSLELEGRLSVRDGCIRLDPTAGKLGSLPLPVGSLESAAGRLFDSPENKDRFRLPPGVRDVSVRGGRLVVTARP